MTRTSRRCAANWASCLGVESWLTSAGRFAALVAVLAGVSWLIGCASAGPTREILPVADTGGTGAALPWEIPRAEWGTQRIVKMRYDGPEGDGTLNLALRFESPDRFHVEASDRLGRRWWDLNVLDGRALVLWVRERTFCRYRGDLEIPALSLGPVPAGAVAALLLLRLPAPPVDQAVAETTAAAGSGVVELDFEDRWDRRWTAVTTPSAPRSWTLHRGARTRATWRIDADGMARLVEPEAGLELRWRQNRPAKPLRSVLRAPEVPDGFVPGVCESGAG